MLLGADGFVGAHLRAAAEAVGLRVIGTSRSTDAELNCDLTDSASVNAAVRRASPDLVVNMAGMASVAEGWRRPAHAFTVNATGVINLMEAVAANAPRAHVVCASSAEVYGAVSETRLPLVETKPAQPLNPYGASKAAMEIVCGQYVRSHQLEIAVIRAFNQIGPGQSPQFAASDFARQIAAAERAGDARAKIYVGDLDVARDFTDVRDSCRAFVAVAQRRLVGTFNLCSGTATRLRDLIDEFGRATRLPLTVTPRRDRGRPAEAPVIVGSAERLRRATGWSPSTPLSQTVSDLLDWWRSELNRGEAVKTQSGVSS